VDIIPAIDIRDGKCVRLLQGDYSKETIFGEDPVEIALRWESEGADWLHIVDLDGARHGDSKNTQVIERICEATKASIQVGGGVRNLGLAQRYRSMGVSRVILGTIAISSPDIVREIIEVLGSTFVIVGVDAREGYLASDGWTVQSDISVEDLMINMVRIGASRFLYTDIARDGTLTQPNYEVVEKLISLTPASIIAAGGISSLDDLVKLSEIGVEASVIGRAIYTGDIKLSDAFDKVE
jgi:phosphoribosylformimino-5-aminoimidazole carboxamide ribotide isomerase